MVNVTLFRTSIICGILHIPLMKLTNKKLRTMWCISIGTSICNHALTKNIIKWLDRCVIITTAISDIYYEPTSKSIWMLSIICYLTSKILSYPKIHVVGHFLITFHHYRMVNYQRIFQKL